MNRKAAETLYPLDENTFLYDEELIIGIRMEQAGLQTWYCGTAVVEHHHGYTTQKTVRLCRNVFGRVSSIIVGSICRQMG